jgi:hypothetical protein
MGAAWPNWFPGFSCESEPESNLTLQTSEHNDQGDENCVRCDGLIDSRRFRKDETAAS